MCLRSGLCRLSNVISCCLWPCRMSLVVDQCSTCIEYCCIGHAAYAHLALWEFLAWASLGFANTAANLSLSLHECHTISSCTLHLSGNQLNCFINTLFWRTHLLFLDKFLHSLFRDFSQDSFVDNFIDGLLKSHLDWYFLEFILKPITAFILDCWMNVSESSLKRLFFVEAIGKSDWMTCCRDVLLDRLLYVSLEGFFQCVAMSVTVREHSMQSVLELSIVDAKYDGL